MSHQTGNSKSRPVRAILSKGPIFLSASIPDRPPYDRGANPVAIREAILALIAVVACKRLIVFGGHPAISPLVEHAARSLNALSHIVNYQSEWFRDKILAEAKAFPNLKWTPVGRDRVESLEIMRQEMVRSQPFAAAVLIGGMEGIIDEWRIFRENHPASPVFPFASTTGAAKQVWGLGEGPTD